MQTENPAGRILYVTGNPNSNRLIILKEEKALYQKVDTNLNFVDREMCIRDSDEQLLKLRTLGMTEAEAENVIIENFLS